MGKVYRRKCDNCDKDYVGAGAKYCSTKCRKEFDSKQREAREVEEVDESSIILQANRNEYKKRYTAMIKRKAFEERICDITKKTLLAMPPLDQIKIPELIPSQNKKINEEAGLLFSDLHMGQVVDKDEMGGFCHYDWTTFQFRYQHLIQSVINIVKNKMVGYNINKLNIMALGDMVTGMIHDELIESADGTVIEWCFGGAYIVAQGLRELAQHFNEIDVDCVVGNHGRMKKKPHYVRKYVNWDQIFYTALMLMLRDQQNIKFTIPKSFFLTKTINNHNFLICHGDNIRSWMGIPWYGINRAIANFTELMASRGQFFEYVALGHFHNDACMRKVSGERLINGSFTGGDQFSLGAMTTISTPVQMLFGVHKDIGISWRFPIKLDLVKEKGIPKYHYDINDNIAEKIINEIY